MALINDLGLAFSNGKSLISFDSDIIHAGLIKSGIFIVTEGENRELYLEFVCPLIRRAFMHVAFPLLVTNNYSMPLTLYQFIIDCLKQFRTNSFSESLSASSGSHLLESKFHFELFSIARGLLGTRGRIDLEVGRVFLSNVEPKCPAVDFYINGEYKWAIELMVEGDRLKEHLERFRQGKKYAAILLWRGPNARTTSTDLCVVPMSLVKLVTPSFP
jgi:hypothetical protein